MKKLFSIFLYLVFLCVQTHLIFPLNEESSGAEESAPRGAKETVIHGLIGSSEVLLANGVVMLYNYSYYVFTGFGAWALPTAESVRYNLTVPWEWEDTDGFIVNNLGHLTQGALYYSAGRVNGFGYFESAFFSALGSFTWEAFGESNIASINDFITTVTSAQVSGEILYRLYLEACAAGVPAPFAFFINPMAGFHRLVTGWEPPDYGRNLYDFRAYLGTGYAQTRSLAMDINRELYSFQGLFAYGGIAVVYGDPFEQESRIPFNQFEFDFSVGFNGVTLGDSYTNLKVNAHGYLFSFSPVYTDTDRMSTGLSLHLDYASLGILDESSTINHFSWALDWTVKYRHLFPRDTVVQLRFHSGLTLMGSAKFFSPAQEREFLNYGAGLNGKLSFNLEHKTLGKLEMGASGYAMWCFPETTDISHGTVLWLFTDITYSYFFTKHLSIGITDSLALERGFFDNYPDTRKWNNAVKLFVAWYF